MYGFFESCSYSGFLTFNRVTLDRINDFPDLNNIPVHARNKDKYLIIGNGLNGDPIAVNITNLNTGYLFHDILFENEVTDMDQLFVDMRCPPEEFLYNAVFLNQYPVDAYQSEEYLKNNSPD